MWISFAVALISAIVLVYVPGTLINKALRFDTLLSFVLAPVSSCLCIAIVGVVLYFLPVPINGLIMFTLMMVISLVAFIVSLSQSRKKWETSTVSSASLLSRLPRSMTMFSMMGVQSSKSNWIILAVYVIIGCLFCWYMFLGNILDPAAVPLSFATDPSFLQIGILSQNGIFSGIAISQNPETGDIITSFQSLWQILPAIISSTTSIEISICFNAVMTTFLVFVAPIGIFGFLGILFHKSRMIVCLGSIFALSFGAFPWHMTLSLSYIGCLMALSFVPYAFIAILGFTIQASKVRSKLVYAFVLAATIVSLIASCADMVFALLVMIAPYLISRYFCWVNDFGKFKKPSLAKVMGVLAYLCTCFAVWAIFGNIPISQSIDISQGPMIGNWLEAIAGIAILSLIPTAGAQILLGLICVLGAIILLFKKGFRWLVATWLVCAFLYLLFSLLPAHSLAYAFGFWYVPPSVMAGFLCIASVPLASVFSATIIRGFVAAINSLTGAVESKPILSLVGAVFVVVFLALDVFVAQVSFVGDIQTDNSMALIHDAVGETYTTIVVPGFLIT